MALMISYLNQFPGEKLYLFQSIHTIPRSFLILGLVEFFFFQIIINLVARIYQYFSRSHFSIEYQLGLSDSCTNEVGKRKQDVVEFSERKPCLIEREIDDGSLLGEEVEMVMGRLGIFCHPNEDAKLQQRFGSDEFSRLFEEKEPSLDEVKGAFDVFDENRDGFIDARELQRVLSALGLEDRSRMENCKRMISVFDQNGDGRIDFKEFVKLMENSFC